MSRVLGSIVTGSRVSFQAQVVEPEIPHERPPILGKKTIALDRQLGRRARQSAEQPHVKRIHLETSPVGIANKKSAKAACQALSALGPLAGQAALDIRLVVTQNPDIAEDVKAALAKIKPGHRMENKSEDVRGAGPDLDLDL